jgi:hypothetical protein
MASWQGNYDNSANAPYWAAYAGHLRANNTNAGTLVYENTSDTQFYRPTNETVGLFLVDQDEVTVEGAGAGSTGWVLRTTGEGGRAGRVQQETLICVKGIRSDNNSDDAIYADAVITVTQPTALSSVVANNIAANVVTLSVSGTSVLPSTAVLTYQWQVNNNTGGTWVNIDNGTNVTTGQPGNMTKSNSNTATISLAPTANTANNYVYRAVITATNPGITNSSTTVYSANAQVKIF